MYKTALETWRRGIALGDPDMAAHAHRWLTLWIERGQAEPTWRPGERAAFLRWRRPVERDKSDELELLQPPQLAA